jgi:hypothetical protein
VSEPRGVLRWLCRMLAWCPAPARDDLLAG